MENQKESLWHGLLTIKRLSQRLKHLTKVDIAQAEAQYRNGEPLEAVLQRLHDWDKDAVAEARGDEREASHRSDYELDYYSGRE